MKKKKNWYDICVEEEEKMLEDDSVEEESPANLEKKISSSLSMLTVTEEPLGKILEVLEELKKKVDSNTEAIEKGCKMNELLHKELTEIKKKNEKLQIENNSIREECRKYKEKEQKNNESFVTVRGTKKSRLVSFNEMLETGKEKETRRRPLASEVLKSNLKKNPEVSVEDMVDRCCLQGRRGLKRSLSTESLNSVSSVSGIAGKNYRVLTDGNEIEEDSKFAIIGDSNVKGFVVDKQLQEWVREEGAIVRCYSGITAAEFLRNRNTCLPLNDEVENVVLHLGGNDIHDCADLMEEFMENGEDDKYGEVMSCVSEKIIHIVRKYVSLNKNVGVLLPGHRRGLRKTHIQKLNEILKKKLNNLNVTHLDVGEDMLENGGTKVCCVSDGIHYKYSYLNKIFEKLMEKMNLRFELPSSVLAVSWSKTMPTLCLRCGKRRHGNDRCTMQNIVCKTCKREGHKENVCRTQFEQCASCGKYGHYAKECPWMKNREM